MQIEWKDIPGYEGFYQVSNTGEVKSLSRTVMSISGGRKVEGRVLKKVLDKDGYYRVSLSMLGINKNKTVHRLVADAFIPNPNNYPVINHKDEVKTNNNVDNLEWCSIQYNSTYNCVNYRRMEWRRIPIIAKSDHETLLFDSITQASEELGVNHANVIGCLKNEYGRRTCKGYTFEYANKARVL